MKPISQKRKTINTIIILVISVSVLIYAQETGITGRTQKNGDGCTCHSFTPSQGVTVTISGPDEVTINETVNYTVSISGGPLIRGGTNIAAQSGVLNGISSDLRKEGGELTHTAPKVPSGSSVTFEFSYTAPSTAHSDIIYANGNSVNFNGQNTGDQWNFAPNKTVNVVSTVDVKDEDNLINNYILYQNYPNPFNPSTVISWNMKESGNVILKIYDAAGNEVKTLVDDYRGAGINSISFNGLNISSGVYYYKLIVDNFIEVKKMLMMK